MSEGSGVDVPESLHLPSGTTLTVAFRLPVGLGQDQYLSPERIQLLAMTLGFAGSYVVQASESIPILPARSKRHPHALVIGPEIEPSRLRIEPLRYIVLLDQAMLAHAPDYERFRR